MPARLISIPFLILTAVFGYLTLEKNDIYPYILLALVIALALIYTFSPQINWWWYKRFPPDIDKHMRQLLIKHLPFYNNLSVTDKKKFRNRMALYMMAVDFMPKGWDNVPSDIKGVVAANIVQMTFNQKDFLLPKFERIVVYTIPFPSPQFPKTLHASEIYAADGVLLFSAQQMMLPLLQPQQYYNLVLHEYIKVYQLSYPNKAYPKLKEEDWQILTQISKFKKEQVTGIIGLPGIDPTVVSGTLFFTHPKKYKEIAPKWYKKWEAIFA